MQPQAPKPTVDSSSINGAITNRTMDLISQLNQVIAFEGTGTQNFTFVNFDDLNTITETILAVHNIKPEGANWQDREYYYFQASPMRLDEIKKKIDSNVQKMKDDLTSNITNLFNLINTKETLFNSSEESLNAVSDYDSVLSQGSTLNNQIYNSLTSDAALNKLIEDFFASFQLNIQRMQSEIFDLLDDGDEDFSNNSTEDPQVKYIISQEDIDGVKQPNIIANNKDQLFAKTSELITAKLGVDWNDNDQFIKALIDGGKLKLDNTIVAKIIEDKRINQETQDAIDSSSRFLEFVSREELISIAKSVYNKTSDSDALKELFKDHLAKTTPKYFTDARSVKDILIGKNPNSNSANPLDKIFISAKDQVKNIFSSTVQMYQNGFERSSQSILQDNIRNNPLGTLEYLWKAQKEPTTDSDTLEKIDSAIELLEQRFNKQIENQILLYKKTNQNQSKIDELEAIKSTSPNETNLQALKDIISKHFQTASISGDASTVLTAINEPIAFYNTHTALFGNESLEAEKINTRYIGRKLPEARPDGSMPDDTTIIPPYVSASPYAAVIAKIGDTILNKALALSQGANIPDAQWASDNMRLLKTINEKLPSFPGGSAASLFLGELKTNFKSVLTEFINSKAPLKTASDEARAALEAKHNELNNLNNNISQIQQARNQRRDLQRESTNLLNIINSSESTEEEKAEARLSLYGSGNMSSPAPGSILFQINELNTLANQDTGNLESSKTRLEGEEQILITRYKNALTNYSNALTDDIDNDDDNNGESNLERGFKDILNSNTKFDLDGNGINDFVDIQGIASRLTGLSDQIRNIFGSPNQAEGGIDKQSIRRLLAINFALSILEANDWDYRRNEAETAGYEVSS